MMVICQAITEIALEPHAPITVEEFHTLNRCLDTAIAEAVAERVREIVEWSGGAWSRPTPGKSRHAKESVARQWPARRTSR